MSGKGLKLKNIRAKLIMSLIAICIIPLVIQGGVSYIQSKQILSNKLTLTST